MKIDPSLVCVYVINLLFNIDYGIIMPSLWLYLQSLGAHNTQWLGFVFAIFALVRMVFSPIVGALIDRSSMKLALIAGLILGVIGNLFYGLATAPWLILVSRAICGLGAAGTVSCITYITRTTTEDARVGEIAKMVTVGQLGLLIGPALNFGIEHFNIRITKSISINELNAPGHLMAILLLIATIIILIFFKDPPLVKETKEELKESFFVKYKNFIGWGTFTSCVVSFTRTFNLTSLETIVTPISTKYYGWSPLKNSFFFAGMIVFSILVIVGLRLFGKKLSERNMIIIGNILIGMGLVGYLIVFILDQHYVPLSAFFILGIFIIMGLPFLMISNSSLMSKMVEKRMQGFAQGVLSSTFSLGSIFGPLWSGSVLDYNPILMISLPLSISIFLACLIGYSYRFLIPRVDLEDDSRLSLIEHDAENIYDSPKKIGSHS